ncbi:N-chimaerin [Desmophyllum pertusum]|uniref:N-chimaerin n=1 Tax=Desmophyllum pertusum TaxID=174260 RepID=A0A9W9Z5R4_9CNID|nr:N-chimaerin [Desmophyllum pertusum]
MAEFKKDQYRSSKGEPIAMMEWNNRRPHNFKIYTFKGLNKRCGICKNVINIWGLTKQGVKCQDCGFNAHKQCSAVIPDNCQPAEKYARRERKRSQKYGRKAVNDEVKRNEMAKETGIVEKRCCCC